MSQKPAGGQRRPIVSAELIESARECAIVVAKLQVLMDEIMDGDELARSLSGIPHSSNPHIVLPSPRQKGDRPTAANDVKSDNAKEGKWTGGLTPEEIAVLVVALPPRARKQKKQEAKRGGCRGSCGATSGAGAAMRKSSKYL